MLDPPPPPPPRLLILILIWTYWILVMSVTLSMLPWSSSISTRGWGSSPCILLVQQGLVWESQSCHSGTARLGMVVRVVQQGLVWQSQCSCTALHCSCQTVIPGQRIQLCLHPVQFMHKSQIYEAFVIVYYREYRVSFLSVHPPYSHPKFDKKNSSCQLPKILV